MFRGTKGTLVADFGNRILVPAGTGADMTYYEAPSKRQVAPPHGHFAGQWITACKGSILKISCDQVVPPNGDFVGQWINACKGNLKTSCDFDYAGRMIETLMLGLAAHKAGKKLNYDPVEGRVTNDPIANDYLRKEYRKGWVLNG